MCLGTFSAYPKIQIWEKNENRKNQFFFVDLAKSAALEEVPLRWLSIHGSDADLPQHVQPWQVEFICALSGLHAYLFLNQDDGLVTSVIMEA